MLIIAKSFGNFIEGFDLKMVSQKLHYCGLCCLTATIFDKYKCWSSKSLKGHGFVILPVKKTVQQCNCTHPFDRHSKVSKQASHFASFIGICGPGASAVP